MNHKVAPKTGIKRTRTRLIVFLLSVMFTEYILGCFQPPAYIPEKLSGNYKTTHPEYEGQFIELSPGLITLGFGGGKYKFYDVERVEKKIIHHRTLYTILCGNEAQGEEFNFAFFTDFADEGIIHFKNKPQVAWEKTSDRNIYNDNADTQIRH